MQVEKAATLLLKDTEGVERLVAYIQSQDIDLLELENTLRDRVPSNQIPSLFQKLHKLPTMTSGEVGPRFKTYTSLLVKVIDKFETVKESSFASSPAQTDRPLQSSICCPASL